MTVPQVDLQAVSALPSLTACGCFPERIASADVQHSDLLARLQALSYAPPTLTAVQRQLEQSQAGLAAEQAGVAALHAKTGKEFDDWKAIEQRTLKRLWVKIKHPVHGRERLSALEAKEEAEYVAALTAERTAAARTAVLEDQVRRLTAQVGELRGAVDGYKRARAELDALYRRVFDGPTPAFPEEDRLEGAYRAALDAYNAAQGSTVTEQRAAAYLAEADGHLQAAIKIVGSSTDYATMNAYGGLDDVAMVEHSELAQAQREADQARLLVEQAQQLLPGLPALRDVQMPKGNMISDVFFDSTWSELAFRQRVDDADTQLRAAQAQLHALVGQVQAQSSAGNPRVQRAAQDLEQARGALENIRRNIMLRGGA